ncbi:MAG: helix-turn-helix domain-containing protein [Salinivirgaceae bacterium]|jgi:excisionase family DNA binding protein|nr:helix-turn-helix domain-containing protein [Salinivirgaceae bacterium]
MSSTIKIKRICEHCQKEFEAKTTVTRFCSKSCNSAALKQKQRKIKIDESNTESLKQKENIITQDIAYIKSKDVLTISDAAIYLAVSRQTIYNWLNSGLIKGKRMTNRKVLILKTDLLTVFDNNQAYEKPKAIKRKPITEFYTIEEIKDKFNVANTWVFNIIKKNNIPKTQYNGKTHVSKKHIDKYFEAKDRDTANINEWYTVQELINKYGLTRDQVYTRINRFNIPRKKEGRFSRISKKHFDEHHFLKL